MRISAFSEFAYGHAVIRETEARLCTQPGQTLLTAPHLPNLRQEARLGYDVRIDSTTGVVVYQFKLGEYLKGPGSNSPTWPYVGRQHFRVRFDPGDNQLDLMRQQEQTLSRIGGPRAIVRYIAPAFTSAAEFTAHYLSRGVVAASYACRPSRVPRDGDAHHLVHVPGSPPITRVWSEPVDASDDELEQALARAGERPQDRDRGRGEDSAPGNDGRRGFRADGDRDSPADRGGDTRAGRGRDGGEGAGQRESAQREAPEVAVATGRTLIEYASSRPEITDGDIDRLERRAAEGFPGRPDLEHASVAIELGATLGLAIGFTGTVS